MREGHAVERSSAPTGGATPDEAASRPCRSAAAQRGGATVTFTAPGDDWYAGRATSYRVTADGTTTTVPATVDAGGRQSVTVPSGAQKIVIQAGDDAGNLGPQANL